MHLTIVFFIYFIVNLFYYSFVIYLFIRLFIINHLSVIFLLLLLCCLSSFTLYILFVCLFSSSTIMKRRKKGELTVNVGGKRNMGLTVNTGHGHAGPGVGDFISKNASISAYICICMY